MNKEELRIGNKVFGESQTIETVVGIKGNYIYTKIWEQDKKPRKNKIQEISPVELNEERLILSGATKFPDGESWLLKNRLIGYRECRKIFYDKQTGTDLLHLHKLQNVFYELTGKDPLLFCMVLHLFQ